MNITYTNNHARGIYETHGAPAYATTGSAGLDLRATNTTRIPAGEQRTITTGIAAAIPENHVGLLVIRSSLGKHHRLNLANSVGVIDSDYRGEIAAVIRSHGRKSYLIEEGERVCQLVIIPIAQPAITTVDSLDATARGTGGFGSTNKERDHA